MTVDVPDVRAAFFQAWQANGNDPTQAEHVFNDWLNTVRRDWYTRGYNAGHNTADTQD